MSTFGCSLVTNVSKPSPVMTGSIKSMIDTIIAKRSKGNTTIAITTKTKFILRGINPDSFNQMSPDDPATIAKVKAIGAEMGVSV